jgi:hypothetical protein
MNTSNQFTREAKRVAGALIVSLLVVAPVAASGVPGKQIPQSNVASMALPKATVTPVSAPVVENPRAALNATVKAVSRVKTYRASQTITGTLGYITQTIEFVAPSTTHMLSWVHNSSAYKGYLLEHIILSDTLYYKVGTRWQKSGFIVSDLMENMNFSGVTAMIKASPNYVTSAKYVGPDVVNGVPTQVYQYQMRVPKIAMNATMTLWIGGDHLPYRMDTVSLVKYGSKPIISTASALISDYNAPITITVPITVTQ